MTLFQLFIAGYVLMIPPMFVWSVAACHGYEVENFSIINNRPRWGMALFQALLWPGGAVANLLVWGLVWTWPRRGVTYDVIERPEFEEW